MENGRVARSMVFVYISIEIMHNMKATTTMTKNMHMVNLHIQMVQSMKENITTIREKAMVFTPFQMELNTMGLIKMAKSMGLDSGTRMDKQRK